ncbi:hypothetical protein ABIB15_002138 [Marisediminicola sp. UYEF4]|uniref:hypothetical protein n=1 Tax=Marisediminicola sp. UYEF4 TaxID=1756384 RepID=UPI003395757F
MGLFSTRTAAVPEGLHEGYDDPESWFSIPEDLREFWTEHAASVKVDQIGQTIDLLAELVVIREARGKAGMRYLPPQTGVLQSFKRLSGTRDIYVTLTDIAAVAGVAEYIDEHYDELRAKAVHSIRAHEVADLRARMVTKAAADAKHHATYLCAVCNVSDPIGGGGIPKARLVDQEKAPWPNHEQIELISCFKCFLVARTLLAEKARAESVGGLGQTREQVVLALLAETPSRGHTSATARIASKAHQADDEPAFFPQLFPGGQPQNRVTSS